MPYRQRDVGLIRRATGSRQKGKRAITDVPKNDAHVGNVASARVVGSLILPAVLLPKTLPLEITSEPALTWLGVT